MRVAAAIAALAVMLPAQASAKTFPTRIQVTAKEFYYTLSSRTVKPGPAVIQFVNYGEDPHDMRVSASAARRSTARRSCSPGQIYNLSLKLVPGRYQLWCSIANHRELGMQAVLIVKAT